MCAGELAVYYCVELASLNVCFFVFVHIPLQNMRIDWRGGLHISNGMVSLGASDVGITYDHVRICTYITLLWLCAHHMPF